MIIPDINLLVYAYNAADPDHNAAKEWWERLLNGTDPVGLSWVGISGFIRIMTHPRVLVQPMPTSLVSGLVREWIDLPSVIVLEPGKRFSSLFLGLLESSGMAGNLTTDAYLAALAIEHQAELHSNDSDFGRFSGLLWKNPIKNK